MFFIVLCAYKPKLSYLREQIDSLRAQTDQGFHCLIQDDASPIDIYDEICALVAGDSRFSVRRNPARLGVYRNFEQGLQNVPPEAELICYCDQDDVWDKTKLARQRAVLADPTVALCHTDLALIDGSGRLLHPSCFAFEGRNVRDYSVPQLILRNSVTGCTAAFRATLLPQLLPFPSQPPQQTADEPPAYHHDLWTALQATQAGRIVALPEALVRYRQHDGNVVGALAKKPRPGSGLFARLGDAGERAALVRGAESAWRLRRRLIAQVLRRARRTAGLSAGQPLGPQVPAAAQLAAVSGWTQGPLGGARLLRFVAAHARPGDALAELGPYVWVGRLAEGARQAQAQVHGLLPFRRPEAPARPRPVERLVSLLGRALPAARREQAVRRLCESGPQPNPEPARPLSSSSSPLSRWLGERLWCSYRVHKPLTLPPQGRRICLFAHYDPDGIVDDYVVYHLAHLHAAGVDCVFVSTSQLSLERGIAKIAPFCAAILDRENRGLDFGSWRTALLVYPELWRCQSLILVNDSVYGPIACGGGVGGLRDLIDMMDRSDCDYWAMTESLQIQPHYQSFFLCFKHSALLSNTVRAFFDNVELLSDKQQIIARYEVGMAAFLGARGLRGAALVPFSARWDGEENPTLHRWRELLMAGMPYLKIQLLRENPHGQPLDDWPEVLEAAQRAAPSPGDSSSVVDPVVDPLVHPLAHPLVHPLVQMIRRHLVRTAR